MLFRGAAYTAFDGEAPDGLVQAAVAAPYAHVTAPLRRLVDRFGLVACEHLLRGAEVPAWVREALPTLPGAMQASDRRAGSLERAVVDLVEAATLEQRVGEEFDAVVVDDGDGRERGEPSRLVQLTEPAVLARCAGTPGARHRAAGAAGRGRRRPPRGAVRARLSAGRPQPGRPPTLGPRTSRPGGRVGTGDRPAEERPGSAGQGGG